MKKTEREKCAVLFSGGKDSMLALYKASQEYEIKFLLSILPEQKDSFMFHSPNEKLLRKQAEMLNFPLIIQKTKGIEEKELDDLRKLIEKVKEKVDVIAIGGLASNYQGKRIKKIVDEAGMKIYAPLWNCSAADLWKEIFECKFKVIITKIASEGIPKEFVGKVLDCDDIAELVKLSKKYGFRIDFEGGDAETAVLYMPLFKKEIKIKFDIESEDKYRHFLKLKEVS